MHPLLEDRITSIWSILAENVADITVPRVDYNAFKIKVTLTDGSTIRINEQYYRDILEGYAYYWLNADNNLIIGWDNAPHHSHLPSFPHHKHIPSQKNVQPSAETTPEDILSAIKNHIG